MEQSEQRALVVKVSHLHNTVEVAVIDAGHGVTDPDRLFEPFFSTKSEGLGMGLNICRTIIESHHGQLWATSNSDGGTTFRFTLPCAPVDNQAAAKTDTPISADERSSAIRKQNNTTEEFSA